MDRANLPPSGAISQERFVMGLAKSQPTQVVGHAVQIRELQRVYAIDNKRVNMFLAIGRRRFAALHHLRVTRLQGVEEAQAQLRGRPALGHEKESKGTTQAKKGCAKSHGAPS